jgi:hypothetical protein
MKNFEKKELEEAARSIESTLHKCEKAFEKLRPGSPQHTLTDRRIKAFQLALALIAQELEQTQPEGEHHK